MSSVISTRRSFAGSKGGCADVGFEIVIEGVFDLESAAAVACANMSTMIGRTRFSFNDSGVDAARSSAGCCKTDTVSRIERVNSAKLSAANRHGAAVG